MYELPIDYILYIAYNSSEVILMNKPANITGPNLRRLRLEAKLSYFQLSFLLWKQGHFISARRLKRIEKQVCKVYVNDLIAFTRFFAVSYDDLMRE